MKNKTWIIAGIFLVALIAIVIVLNFADDDGGSETLNDTSYNEQGEKENEEENEEKTVENFEILFYDKEPLEEEKVYTILDKSETDKYDYSIFGCDGSVNIRIDGKDYSLKEALLENMITMEEIIEKADQDLKDGKIEAYMLNDGGTAEYHYENYTIIKCYTLDGNRDVYIGAKDLRKDDVL